MNDYKFKPECESFWYIDYGYSLENDWDVCFGERATEPGCQYYLNWYAEEVPCDEADEADEALETQGDQGVAEVIDEQTLADYEEEETPLWLKITGWTLLIAIVGYVIYYTYICFEDPYNSICETTTAMISRTFFTDLIDEFLPQKLVFDFWVLKIKWCHLSNILKVTSLFDMSPIKLKMEYTSICFNQYFVNIPIYIHNKHY